jgi:hypothetical protein
MSSRRRGRTGAVLIFCFCAVVIIGFVLVISFMRMWTRGA